MRNGSHHYGGPFGATTHVVVGGGGASLASFSPVRAKWSYVQDHDHGFVKLTAFNHSTLLFEYKRSRDGRVYDHFMISHDYRDILACTFDSCQGTTLASWIELLGIVLMSPTMKVYCVLEISMMIEMACFSLQVLSFMYLYMKILHTLLFDMFAWSNRHCHTTRQSQMPTLVLLLK